MSRYKLLPALHETFKDWGANNKRYSWLYCPICKHDLNGDNESFIEEKNDCWFYRCSNCGCESKWDLRVSMMPYPTHYQQFTKRLLAAPKKEVEDV